MLKNIEKLKKNIKKSKVSIFLKKIVPYICILIIVQSQKSILNFVKLNY
jgi:hypothetical protein